MCVFFVVSKSTPSFHPPTCDPQKSPRYSVPSPVLLEPSIQEQAGITLQGLGFLLGELLDAGTTSLVSERIADLLPVYSSPTSSTCALFSSLSRSRCPCKAVQMTERTLHHHHHPYPSAQAAMDEPWDVISRKKENAASRLRRLEKRAFRGAQTTPAPSSVLEPLQTLQKLAKRRSKLHALNVCNSICVCAAIVAMVVLHLLPVSYSVSSCTFFWNLSFGVVVGFSLFRFVLVFLALIIMSPC
mgnify:CR=1 FL=1